MFGVLFVTVRGIIEDVDFFLISIGRTIRERFESGIAVQPPDVLLGDALMAVTAVRLAGPGVEDQAFAVGVAAGSGRRVDVLVAEISRHEDVRARAGVGAVGRDDRGPASADAAPAGARRGV